MIEVREVCQIFGNNPKAAFPLMEQGKTRQEIMEATGQVVALRDITFTVEKGEVFVLMGLSGSGKSTLLRCINRLRAPIRGSVTIAGEDVLSLDVKGLRDLRRHVVGMVFQKFGLLPHRTVADNVAFGLEVSGVPGPERAARVAEVLDVVGLGGWADNPIHNLSGGMQQRVGLARALAIDPEVLLMDEPFSALDPLIRTEMQEELLRLQDRMNKTILFVSHDMQEAIKLGNRMAILNGEGQVVQVGTPREIVTDPADDYVKAFTQNVDAATLEGREDT